MASASIRGILEYTNSYKYMISTIFMGCMDRRPFENREKALEFAVNRCPMRGTPENFDGGFVTYPCGIKRDLNTDCDFRGDDYRNCKYYPKKS